MIKNRTLQFHIKRLTAYICCFATSTILFAKPINEKENRINIIQQITNLQSQLDLSHREFENIIFKQYFCTKLLPKCLKIKDISKTRRYYFNNSQKLNRQFIEFPIIIDLKKLVTLSNILNLSINEQKKIIQETSTELNKLSSSWFTQKYKIQIKQNKLNLINIAINNSIGIAKKNERGFAPIKIDEHSNQKRITVGILDSGVSTFHQQMAEVDIIQYNPLDQSSVLRDTAFGHASGILSLLAVKQNSDIKKGFIEDGKYLSCNGLPKGKFNESLILQCMNWFFLQPRVDVIINAWLASDAGCKNEWQQPIEALLASNIIPVFSAGNYADSKKGMSFSPANLVLDNLDYPLITVGALNKELERLTSSSFGLTTCKNKQSFKHYQANIFAKGENLKVAIPLAKNTYQFASGTSYSIAEIAANIAKLKQNYPSKSNKEVINSILDSATRFHNNSDNGYGRINYLVAQKLLEQPQ